MTPLTNNWNVDGQIVYSQTYPYGENVTPVIEEQSQIKRTFGGSYDWNMAVNAMLEAQRKNIAFVDRNKTRRDRVMMPLMVGGEWILTDEATEALAVAESRTGMKKRADGNWSISVAYNGEWHEARLEKRGNYFFFVPVGQLKSRGYMHVINMIYKSLFGNK